MDIQVSIKKYDHQDWFLIDLSLSENDSSISYQHLCSISSPECVKAEVAAAVKFAKSLLNGTFEQSGITDSSIPEAPLSINGFQPVEVKEVEANLDLPDRSEFEETARRREIEFLASHLQLEVDSESTNPEQALKYLKTQANSLLLPVYADKMNYFLSVSGHDSAEFNEFNEDLVSLFNQLLEQCEQLSSDVLVSDSESLAEKHEFNLPVESLAESPFLYFKNLHIEDLNRSVEYALTQEKEWSQTA